MRCALNQICAASESPAVVVKLTIASPAIAHSHAVTEMTVARAGSTVRVRARSTTNGVCAEHAGGEEIDHRRQLVDPPERRVQAERPDRPPIGFGQDGERDVTDDRRTGEAR